MSHISLAQRTLIGITPVVLALVFTSCIFSPGKDDRPPPPTPPVVYPPLNTPEATLEALREGYENRDSAEIKLVYDIDYQGTSFDPATLNPFSLTRQDEI